MPKEILVQTDKQHGDSQKYVINMICHATYKDKGAILYKKSSVFLFCEIWLYLMDKDLLDLSSLSK